MTPELYICTLRKNYLSHEVAVCMCVNFTLKFVHLCRSSFQKIKMPATLYEAVVEVDERVVLEQKSCQLLLNTSIVTSNAGESVQVGGEGKGGG